jgi:hypothetical protein
VLNDDLMDLVALLRRAFPGGVPSEDYRAFLVVLSDELSEENLGKVVEELTGENQYVAIHDAVEAQTTRPPDRRDVDRVRSVLVEHGWMPDD